MTDDDIARVRASFAVLAPRAQPACLAFYRHLFALAPDCRALFGDDLDGQARKLAGMLDALVERLDDPACWTAQCRALGERHVDYGATEDHYDAVGAALLRMLREGLGEAWDEATAAAWSTLYGELAETMMDAARGHEAGADLRH